MTEWRPFHKHCRHGPFAQQGRPAYARSKQPLQACPLTDVSAVLFYVVASLIVSQESIVRRIGVVSIRSFFFFFFFFEPVWPSGKALGW